MAPDRPDVLSVGGFSDAVFDVPAAFELGDAGRFAAEVELGSREEPGEGFAFARPISCSQTLERNKDA